MDMNRSATIKDVAAKANVSVTTVSRYINDAEHVSAKCAEKIRSAITETGYQPNLMARSLKTQKSHTIVLIVPDICNPFYSLMAKTVQRIARTHNYLISFCDTDGEENQEVAAICAAQQQNACGILFASIDIKPQVIEQMKRAQIPIVGLNAYSNDFPFDSVHVLQNGGTYIAMQHLIELKHSRIVYAGGTPSSMIARNRREGYELAMREFGLHWSEQDIFEMGFSQEDGYKAGRYFSTFTPLPTAICCANDQIALGVIDALQSVGLSVPEDISVTGMDDIPYSRTSKPSLTTITNDGAQYAQIGMSLLLERVSGKYDGKKRSTSVPNTLILRQSTRILNGE